MIKDETGLYDVQDINSLFSELSGLLEIRELDNSGLSEKGLHDLNQINTRVLYLMQKNANLA